LKIILYVNEKGEICKNPQRRIFSFVDGIIGGENNGPLTPDSKNVGIVIAGFNPLAVDIVGVRLMGFDWRKLKWAVRACEFSYFSDPSIIKINSNILQFTTMFQSQDVPIEFKPHPGWKGYIEV